MGEPDCSRGAVTWATTRGRSEWMKTLPAPTASFHSRMFCCFFFKPFNEGRCELILDQLYKGNAVFLDRLYFKRYVIFKDSFFSELDCPGKHRMIAIWHSKVSSVQMYKPDFWLMTTYLKVHTCYFLCRSTKKAFIRLITKEPFLKYPCLTKGPIPAW